MKKRILSMLMICLLMLGMVITPPTIEADAAETDYRKWAQSDSRWGSLCLGSSSDTVSKSGCTVTAVTKLIIQAGKKDAASFNVGTLVKWLNSNSGFDGSGCLYWNKPATYSGLSYYGILKSTGSYSSNEYNSNIINWIEQGYHMVVQVKNETHWVAIDEAKSLSTGKVYIMDSLSSGANADITLSSRYSTFNRIMAYKGGTTPSVEGHTYTKGEYKYYWDAHPHYKCYQCTMCDEIKEDKSETVKLETCEQCYPTKATITFDANGGTCSTSSKQIDFGAQIGTLPTPTRDGYVFVGWSSSPKSNYHIVDSTFTYDKDTTLYAHWTSGVYDGIKLDFDANGGTLPTYVAACGVDGFNVPRDTHELIVYNCDGEYVATNYYGYEIAVNANGVVTAKRNYGDNTQLQVPAGGFVVSANGTTSNETAKFVHDIAVGMYVGYDEGSAKIYSYSSNNAYLVNHRYMDVNDTYSYLPRPSRDGYLFDGWLDPWNGDAGYFDIYEACSLHASWTPEDEAVPYASCEYNGHVYELYDYIMSWEEAEAFCKERGGTLATITDSNEQALIEELVVVGNRGQYYIGATDANSEGNWEWVTGESFSYSNWDARAGEPNGGASANWATVMGRDNAPNKTVGEWNDVVSCDDGSTFYNATNTGFILEKEPTEDVIEAITLKIQAGDSSAILTWNSIGNRDSEEYEIFREVNSSGNFERYATAARVYTFEDDDLAPGNRYCYFVRAYTTDGAAIDSNINGVRYNIDAPVLTVDKVIEGTATLSWNAVEGADHYIIHINAPWDESTDGFIPFIRTADTSAEVVSRLDETYYTVEAIGYDESITAQSDIVTTKSELPIPEIDIGVDTGNKKPLISWNPIWGTTTFQVQRSTSASGTYTTIHTTDINNVYVDETAEAGNIYYYRVRAVVLDDNGAVQYESYSAAKSITLQLCANGHTSKTIPAVAATCESDGSTEGALCSVCGVIIAEPQVIPATGHVHKIIPAVSATCIKAGYTEGAECSVCGVIIATPQTIPATGHTDEIIPAAPATCVKVGSTEGTKCSVCGIIITATKVVPATGHTSKITPAVPSTCEKAGLTEGAECSVCGVVIKAQQAIPAKGHSAGAAATENIIEATCESVGSYETVVYCSSCKKELSRVKSIVSAKGHKYDSGVITTAPSCEYTGTKTYTCLNDNTHTYTEVVSATGHSEVKDIAIAPTCEKTGLTEGRHCSVCGKVTVAQIIVPAKGHNYVNGVCASCGKKEPVSITAPVIKSSSVANTGKIKLTWDAVEGAAKYRVYRATSKTGKYSIMKTVEGTSYINSTAKAGTRYYYYVVAIDANGNVSEKSNIVNRVCDLPRTTVTLSNVASSGKIKVAWTKVDGAAKYQVYRATSKTGTYSLKKTTTSLSWTDTNTTAGKTYYYKVKAVHSNTNANSALTAYKSRTCDLKRPTVSITRSSGKPKVSWTAVTGATKYKIYRSTSKTGTYKLVKTTTSKSWKDTTAKKGKTYYYKVVAVHSNTAANSAYSKVKSIKCTK